MQLPYHLGYEHITLIDIVLMGWRLCGSHVTPRLEVHVPTSVLPHLGGQRTPYYTLADGLFAHAEQVGRLPHSHPPGWQPVTPYVTPYVTPLHRRTSYTLRTGRESL